MRGYPTARPRRRAAAAGRGAGRAGRGRRAARSAGPRPCGRRGFPAPRPSALVSPVQANARGSARGIRRPGASSPRGVLPRLCWGRPDRDAPRAPAGQARRPGPGLSVSRRPAADLPDRDFRRPDVPDDVTAHLSLPYIAAAQAQKHVTHNEALHILDSVVQLAVIDRDLAAPPRLARRGRPLHRRRLANRGVGRQGRQGRGLHRRGLELPDARARLGRLRGRRGDALLLGRRRLGVDAERHHRPAEPDAAGVGATADATNPFSAKLNKALWTARTAAEGGDGDLRYAMNKENRVGRRLPAAADRLFGAGGDRPGRRRRPGGQVERRRLVLVEPCGWTRPRAASTSWRPRPASPPPPPATSAPRPRSRWRSPEPRRSPPWERRSTR